MSNDEGPYATSPGWRESDGHSPSQPPLTQQQHASSSPSPWITLSEDNINAISGSIAGLVAGAAVCPLDVAKTRLQAQGGFRSFARSANPESKVGLKYSGVVGTLRTIWLEEGIRGLYRGLGPIVIGYIPTWTIYFTLYEKTKRKLGTFDISSTLQHVASAVTAGGCSTVATNPIWVIKTRLMSQSKTTQWQYMSTLDAVRSMLRNEGIMVFYSGLGPALLGLTHVAIQFPLYERFKMALNVDSAGTVGSGAGIMIASAASKVLASSITYPHEVIRTRNQIQVVGSGSPKYRGIISTARVILREEGWRAFYAGLGTNMIRAVPSSVVTLATYEIASHYLKKNFICDDDGLTGFQL